MARGTPRCDPSGGEGEIHPRRFRSELAHAGAAAGSGPAAPVGVSSAGSRPLVEVPEQREQLEPPLEPLRVATFPANPSRDATVLARGIELEREPGDRIVGHAAMMARWGRHDILRP